MQATACKQLCKNKISFLQSPDLNFIEKFWDVLVSTVKLHLELSAGMGILLIALLFFCLSDGMVGCINVFMQDDWLFS